MPRLRDRNRLILLARGLAARRGRPDLGSLARERDPERFLWRILPHAARSFASSIVVLPRRQARAAAVAYLYCRMLDSYEDLQVRERRVERLLAFGDRFSVRPIPPADRIPPTLATDDRDRLHLLLVERCGEIDEIFASLPAEAQSAIAELVHAMAAGMAWSTETLDRQGGAFLDEAQLRRYCHHVIGEPIVFALRLVGEYRLSKAQREDAMAASEMIQLANVTRDIERDLVRGVAYHPDLKPLLGAVPSAADREVVRRVREELLVRALAGVSAYRGLTRDLVERGAPGLRAGAVLMILFTDLYYRGCAVRAGHPAWPGLRGRTSCVLAALPAMLSRRWAARVIARVERRFLEAKERLDHEAEPTEAGYPSRRELSS